ncbi:MAG TPA: cell division protein ZipA C-terminal FtsZ-binding domain-containing protein [Burkholderiales bacterium]|nr:cell division protein ZipA C-terminal FtsZ-binding domain-containing protein [Burkholderiales bacterium]
MSDLQLSLLAIGILIVAATYAFNWLQERKYRRKSESAFKNQFHDVLLESRDTPGEERVEPRLGGIDTQKAPPASKPVFQSEAADAALDPEIALIAEVNRAQPFSAEETKMLAKRLLEFGRRAVGCGYNEMNRSWEKLAETDSVRCSRVKVGLQLADRSGCVKESQLALFYDLLQSFAEATAADLLLPDRNTALEQAVELDEFCAEVDISIGLNVIAQGGPAFPGTKLRALSEAAGLKLLGDGAYHCLNEQGESLYALFNHEAAPFTSEQIKNLSIPGVTLLLDVPRVASGVRVFDQMLACARQLAAALGGRLVDDNRAPLNDAGVEKIRVQLRVVYTLMERRNISAGSPRALRLFS